MVESFLERSDWCLSQLPRELHIKIRNDHQLLPEYLVYMNFTMDDFQSFYVLSDALYSLLWKLVC